MLINISNHPSSTWTNLQMETALVQFGKVVDYPFPYINPENTIEQIRGLAKHTFDQIMKNFEDENIQIHLMGEHTFVFQLLLLFKQNNIRCYVSTTHRIVDQLDDGTKNVKFKFEKFRPYF